MTGSLSLIAKPLHSFFIACLSFCLLYRQRAKKKLLKELMKPSPGGFNFALINLHRQTAFVAFSKTVQKTLT